MDHPEQVAVGGSSSDYARPAAWAAPDPRHPFLWTNWTWTYANTVGPALASTVPSDPKVTQVRPWLDAGDPKTWVVYRWIGTAAPTAMNATLTLDNQHLQVGDSMDISVAATGGVSPYSWTIDVTGPGDFFQEMTDSGSVAPPGSGDYKVAATGHDSTSGSAQLVSMTASFTVWLRGSDGITKTWSATALLPGGSGAVDGSSCAGDQWIILANDWSTWMPWRWQDDDRYYADGANPPLGGFTTDDNPYVVQTAQATGGGAPPPLPDLNQIWTTKVSAGHIGMSPCQTTLKNFSGPGCLTFVQLSSCFWVSGFQGPPTADWYASGTYGGQNYAYHAHTGLDSVSWNFADGVVPYVYDGANGLGDQDGSEAGIGCDHNPTGIHHTYVKVSDQGPYQVTVTIVLKITVTLLLNGRSAPVPPPNCPGGMASGPGQCTVTLNSYGTTDNPGGAPWPLLVTVFQIEGIPISTPPP